MWKTGKGTLKGRSRGRSNWAEGETTVVLTGLPRTLNADILLELVDKKFHRCYDFFYLPMYLDQLENTGLAYLNFRDHATAVECQRYFEGSIDWSGHISDRPCKAQWSSIQGYEANITRHRKAEWLEKNVPEDCKPMAFDEQGRRLPTLEVFTPLQPLHSTDSGKGGKYQRLGKGKQWERDWYGASKPHAGKGSNWPGWYSDRNIETDSRQSDSGYANAAFEPFDDSASWPSWLQAAANWQAMEMTAGVDDSWGNPNEGNMTSALDLYLASMDSTDRYSDEAYGQASGQTFEPTFPLQESFEKRADTFERDPSNTRVEDPTRLPKPLIPELPVLEHLHHERGEQGSPQTSPQMSPSSTASEPGQLGLRKYACPNCKLIFAKWSACQHHLVSDMKCWCVLGEGRLPSDVTELQEKCKAAAEERPKDSEPTAAFVDEAIQDKVLRFQ
ncbi:ML5 [Symbiodinium necroappetens]|uniref:ML5 protein n=1 Tax=Symbiodinium necroappetens TaxID=1628268 RepID=A0A813A347_9DINO|nr:ML5 [Symbiodinium necroappetens]